jgi:hypothetical protein
MMKNKEHENFTKFLKNVEYKKWMNSKQWGLENLRIWVGKSGSKDCLQQLKMVNF